MNKENIFLPEKIEYIEEGPNKGRFIIEPCFPGYGTTWGNTLRRVLMSSLKGGAVDRMAIKGVRYEFAGYPGAKEDVLQIILNLKKLRFKMFTDETVQLSLKAKGVGDVLGKDIEKSAEAIVANPEQKLAFLSDKNASLEMQIWVKSGYGWVPSEEKSREGLEVGTLVIDSQFSPVVEVSSKIENIRVGKRTDFERLILSLETDGTCTPPEAFVKAAKLIEEQFNFIGSKIEEELKEQSKPKVLKKEVKKSKEKAVKKTAKKTVKKPTKK